jgi:hypothetical protein
MQRYDHFKFAKEFGTPIWHCQEFLLSNLGPEASGHPATALAAWKSRRHDGFASVNPLENAAVSANLPKLALTFDQSILTV